MAKKIDLMSQLLKRAMGYTVEEIVEEYGGGDKSGELIKRKITKKAVPPDVTALKTYIELNKNQNEFSGLSDDDLLKEKKRIIEEFIKSEQAKKEKR